MSKPLKNPTKLQGALAIASFVVGSIIGSISLFIVPPPGEISNSALGLTSEFLLMCAAMLGVSVAFDYKLAKFETRVKRTLDNNNMSIEQEQEYEQEES